MLILARAKHRRMSNKELIDINETASLMHISIHAVRDYKKRGLIIIADKDGNKDLYDKADILNRYAIISEMRKGGNSLAQIALALDKKLSKRRLKSS